MVEPLPRWAIAFMAALAAVLVVWLASRLLDGGEPKPARWRIDPRAELLPSTDEIPILVNEAACASGRSADGRIDPSVTYGADTIRIDVDVRALGGDQDCPGNPDTPFVVELDEPLGSREITGERWDLP